MVVHVPYGSHASCYAIEVATKVGKAHRTVLQQLVTVQTAVVIAQSAVQRPAVYGLADGRIETYVKQSIVRNQVFHTQVLRLLPHAANACRQFPAIPLVGQVAHVVCQCMQLEEK